MYEGRSAKSVVDLALMGEAVAIMMNELSEKM